MSARLFKDDVLFFQRFLSCCGFYAGDLDGDFGPQTSAAEAAFDQRCQAVADCEGHFDQRSETNIRSLRIDAQVLARRSLKALRDAGRDARIISGTRTYAEQNALFRQGRFGNPGNIVTKARGGQSWHNFGLAWDIGLFEGGAYVTRDPPYRAAAPIAQIAGLEWGGDWAGFPDFPHYQLAYAERKISAARSEFENGGR